MQITLIQNEINVVGLTLRESATYSSPNYVFAFINEFNKENIVIFSATNSSYFTNRYDKFNIELVSATASEDITLGKVILSPNGQWLYNVYATDQIITATFLGSFTYSIDPDPNAIETGKVVITGTNSNITNDIYL